MTLKIRFAAGRSVRQPKNRITEKRPWPSTRASLVSRVVSGELRANDLEETGQRFAVATESNYFKRGDRFERRIVYCHTTRASWAHKGQPYHRCDMYGGRASWGRCSRCPDNAGFGAMASSVYPAPCVCVKLTKPGNAVTEDGDYRYEATNPRCRGCHERTLCVGQNVTTHKQVQLIVLRRKKVRLTLVE